MSTELPTNMLPDTPMVKVKKFLDILFYKQRDMNAYKKEMDECKMNIKMLLDRYKSQQHNVTIHTQQLLVDIHDKYTLYKTAETNYITTQQKVENIKQFIESINIKPYIYNVVQEFNYDLNNI